MRMLTDLRKLRHVVGVARAGSFTGATHTLAITQSALTKSVAEVEHLLGIKLFERLPRGVELTEAGELFVPRAERILADTGELMSSLGQLQDLSAGHLRLGVAPAAYVAFLESTVSAFAKVYPGIHIEVRDGTPDRIARDALSGGIDLVVGGANYLNQWADLDIQPVANLHHFFIGRLDHPLAGTDPTAGDLLAYPVVMPAAGLTTETQLNRAYHSAGLSPRPAQYLCDHFSLVRTLVASTNAISPVVSLAPPGERFRGQFHVFEDVIELEPHTLGLAFARQRDPSPAARAFRDIFQGFVEDSRA